MSKDRLLPWGAAVGWFVVALYTRLVAGWETGDWATGFCLSVLEVSARVPVVGLLLLLPLFDRRSGARSRLGISCGVIAFFLLVSGYVSPLAQRLSIAPGASELPPHAWWLHQVLSSLLTGKDPNGYLLDPGHELVCWGLTEAWLWGLLSLLPGLLLLDRGSRLRLPWWITLPLWAGTIPASSALAASPLAPTLPWGWTPTLGRACLRAMPALSVLAGAWLAGRLTGPPGSRAESTASRAPRRTWAPVATGCVLGVFLASTVQVATHPLGSLSLLPPSELEIPGPAPDLRLRSLDGERIRLRDLDGKVVVLNYWASWCGPCREELPRLKALEEEWGGQGLAVLRVNQAETTEAIEYFMRSYGYSFPVYPATARANRLYPEQGMPTTYIIGKDRRIRERVVGFSPESWPEFRSRVRAYLDEPKRDE